MKTIFRVERFDLKYGDDVYLGNKRGEDLHKSRMSSLT